MQYIDRTPYGRVLSTPAVRELKQYVESTGSHFFDTDTMRWFGTRNLVIVDAVVVVGTDTRAPEDYPRVWGRVFREDGSAERILEGHDRRAVIRKAHKVAAELKAGTYAQEDES